MPRPRISPREARWRQDVGERIACALDAAGLTQAEAADALGVSQPLVSQLIRGRRNPRSYLENLKRCCGVPSAYLYDGSVSACDQARLTPLTLENEQVKALGASPTISADGRVIEPPERRLEPIARTMTISLADQQALAQSGMLELLRLSEPVARALMHQLRISDGDEVKVVTLGLVRKRRSTGDRPREARIRYNAADDGGRK